MELSSYLHLGLWPHLLFMLGYPNRGRVVSPAKGSCVVTKSHGPPELRSGLAQEEATR